ncbi:putative MFS-type transporter YbcL [Tsukamurella sp. TY48]|uniref:MFS transporter n=1 Tax=Tsukamurella sp. TY48 TaxID=2775495 RepID=UPI001C7CAA43|nr:MFS transporter [Tsukamurella sp. TY48]GIZ95526.1 putative MFS-type transporter YbcL [Tsukamurella sp. TY48]
MPAWLFVLFGAGFVLYTDDYVIAGILPEIATDLGVSEGQAGQLITAFSLTVAVAAPVSAIAFARLPRRRLFAGGLLVFVAANAAASFATSFPLLLGLRIVAALAAASVTPALFAFAAQHAPPDRSGRYLAVVSLGVTGSIAAGVPIGTWIGGTVGWQATFATMAAAGAVVLVAMLAVLPRDEGGSTPPPLAEQFATLRSRPVALGLAANWALMTGSMMLYTYLAPYLAATTSAGLDARTLTFALSGIAGAVGIWLGGSAADRWGADRALVVGIGAVAACMIALWLLWLARPMPFPLVLVVATAWAGFAFWNTPVIQARLFALAGPVAPQALALNTSGTHLGVAAGGALGGTLLGTLGIGALPLAAAVAALLSLALIARADSTSDTL